MAILNSTELRSILDSIALTYLRLDAVYGSGIEDYTASKALKTNIERVLDVEKVVSEFTNINRLAQYLYTAYDSVLSVNLYKMFQFALDQVWKLQDNDLDSFLEDNDLRIHPAIKDMYKKIGKTISPKNVMAPPLSNMGTFEVLAGNDAEFIDGSKVDTTKYGNTIVKLKTLVDIGSTYNFSFRVRLEDFDENYYQVDITIPKETPANTEYRVGTGLYTDVTGVTHLSGNEGDKVQFFSIWERELNE